MTSVILGHIPFAVIGIFLFGLPDYAGKEFSTFKKDLADLSVSKLEPITSEMNKLMSDVSYIDSILKQGQDNAIAVAEPVLQKTKEIIGFLT